MAHSFRQSQDRLRQTCVGLQHTALLVVQIKRWYPTGDGSAIVMQWQECAKSGHSRASAHGPMYFLLGLFNRAAEVTACGGEISARCETAKRGSAALVQPRDQLAAFRQQLQELFARTHERFKPLAFLAAQLIKYS
jgi:hypothetical protein